MSASTAIMMNEIKIASLFCRCVISLKANVWQAVFQCSEYRICMETKH
jgi:hypothetical protein